MTFAFKASLQSERILSEEKYVETTIQGDFTIKKTIVVKESTIRAQNYKLTKRLQYFCIEECIETAILSIQIDLCFYFSANSQF